MKTAFKFAATLAVAFVASFVYTIFLMVVAPEGARAGLELVVAVVMR